MLELMDPYFFSKNFYQLNLFVSICIQLGVATAKLSC